MGEHINTARRTSLVTAVSHVEQVSTLHGLKMNMYEWVNLACVVKLFELSVG